MARDQQQSRVDRDPTGSRERRVNVLRDLVAERGYDVPAEDVAASIIRDAIVVASPTSAALKTASPAAAPATSTMKSASCASR